MAAVNKIVRIDGKRVFLNNRHVPIGKYYKKDVIEYVESHRLK